MSQKIKLQDFTRRYAGVPPETSVFDTVKKLIERGEALLYAAEMIFGMRRDAEGSILSEDPVAWRIFMLLWYGEPTDIILLLAEHHYWSPVRARRGYSMQVYPDEWLVIPEPYATQFLDALIKMDK